MTAQDDVEVDGDQEVVITVDAGGYAADSEILTVIDDEAALLTVSIAPSDVAEGSVATGTVERNTGTSGALVVTTEGASQFGEFFAVAPGQVVFLQRIGFQVVKFVRLEGGVVNELPVAPAEGVVVLPVVAQAAFSADED